MVDSVRKKAAFPFLGLGRLHACLLTGGWFYLGYWFTRGSLVWTKVWEGFLVEEAIGNVKVGHSRQWGRMGHS